MISFFNIYGSRSLVLSIYTGAGGWFFRYLRKPEIGPFNIYGSRRLVLSIYAVAEGWLFQYIR